MKVQEIKIETRAQREENARRKQRIRRRIFWIKFILIGVLSMTAVILLALSSLFNIKTIEVTGSTHYNKSEIIQSTFLTIGNNGFKTIGSNVLNIFTLRDGREEKRIKKSFPYVKTVKARFVLPNRFVINITERKASFYVENHGTYLLMDEENSVLESVPQLKIKELPEIKGLHFQQFELGQPLEIRNSAGMDLAKQVLRALADSDKNDSYKVLKVLNYIDVADLRGIIIYVESRIKVNLGDLTDLKYKIDFMKKNIQALSKKDKGYLDMTLEEPVLKP